jgi:hypothetical protein
MDLSENGNKEVQTRGQMKYEDKARNAVLSFLRAWFAGDWEKAIKYCQTLYIAMYHQAGIKPKYALYQGLYWGTEFEGFEKVTLKEAGDLDDRITHHAYVIAYTKKKTFGLIVPIAWEEDIEEWRVFPTSIYRPITPHYK